MEADKFGLFPFGGRGIQKRLHRRRMALRDFRFYFSKVPRPFLAPADRLRHTERALQFPAKHGRIRNEKPRPDFGDDLAVRLQRRHVDTVHGGAAHQPDGTD